MRISDWSSDVCSSDLRVALGPGERTVEMGGIHLTLMIGAVGLVVTVAEHEIPPQGRLRDERWSRTAKALAPHRSCAADRVRWRRFRPAPPSLAARREEHPPDHRHRPRRARRLPLAHTQIANGDRKSTRLNSSHYCAYRLPSPA